MLPHRAGTEEETLHHLQRHLVAMPRGEPHFQHVPPATKTRPGRLEGEGERGQPPSHEKHRDRHHRPQRGFEGQHHTENQAAGDQARGHCHQHGTDISPQPNLGSGRQRSVGWLLLAHSGFNPARTFLGFGHIGYRLWPRFARFRPASARHTPFREQPLGKRRARTGTLLRLADADTGIGPGLAQHRVAGSHTAGPVADSRGLRSIP